MPQKPNETAVEYLARVLREDRRRDTELLASTLQAILSTRILLKRIAARHPEL